MMILQWGFPMKTFPCGRIRMSRETSCRQVPIDFFEGHRHGDVVGGVQFAAAVSLAQDHGDFVDASEPCMV